VKVFLADLVALCFNLVSVSGVFFFWQAVHFFFSVGSRNGTWLGWAVGVDVAVFSLFSSSPQLFSVTHLSVPLSFVVSPLVLSADMGMVETGCSFFFWVVFFPSRGPADF